MKKMGIDYERFKSEAEEKEQEIRDIQQIIDPKYIKPETLIEYEHSEDKFNKILDTKRPSASKMFSSPIKKALLR